MASSSGVFLSAPKHRRAMSFESDVLFLKPRRRSLYTVCISLVAVSVVGVVATTLWSLRSTSYRHLPEVEEMATVTSPKPVHDVDHLDSPNFLVGPPTDRFRDNLLPNEKYITSWISAGWTNDVMTYMNLVYLGILTNRIPILPMFTPSHIGGHIPPVDFGEVFDVPRLRKEMQKPILEWHEVKNRSSEVVDELGCWNTWEAVQDHEKFARRSSVPGRLNLDISYTKTPSWIKVIPAYEHDLHSSFSALATLGFPEMRQENLVEPSESPQHLAKLPPDEQLLCYDYLYYVCSHQPYEFDFDYSPAWLFAGRFMHWTPELEALAEEYVRRTVGVYDDNDKTPPYIAIHVRHGDFKDWCGTVAVEDCFAPISVIARRVEEVKAEILERKGIIVENVIMTSDEKNPTWWKEVTDQGWFGIDHSETIQRYGAWYPVFIDAVIQSGGLGFVGTDRSTMSVLARRRTQSWRDGAVRVVKWGRLGSDDH